MRSNKSQDVDYIRALEDVETRKEFIHREHSRFLSSIIRRTAADLQKLLAVTKDFVAAITSSTRKVPYSIRYLAHEMLVALRVRLFRALYPF